MDRKLIKGVRINKVNEVKLTREQILNSIEELNLQSDRAFVPIWDGRGTDIRDNLFMFIENIRLEDDVILADIEVTYAFLNFINHSDNHHGILFYDDKRAINYIPVIKDGMIVCWNVENRFSSIEKYRNHLVKDIVKKDTFAFLCCYVKVDGKDITVRDILLNLLGEIDRTNITEKEDVIDVAEYSMNLPIDNPSNEIVYTIK